MVKLLLKISIAQNNKDRPSYYAEDIFFDRINRKVLSVAARLCLPVKGIDVIF